MPPGGAPNTSGESPTLRSAMEMGTGMRTMARGLLVAAVVVLTVVALVGSVEAQPMTVETIPPEVDESGRTAGERVDQIVLILRILAGVVLAGTVAFWWHTRPTSGDVLDESSAPVPDQEATAGET